MHILKLGFTDDKMESSIPRCISSVETQEDFKLIMHILCLIVYFIKKLPSYYS